MKKKKVKKEKANLHSPTLKTILMVEDALKGMNESIITVAGLKMILPRQVNHNTLMKILEYLEKSGKIDVALKGIVWVENNNPRLQKAVREGFGI
jgi:hypothetical protein